MLLPILLLFSFTSYCQFDSTSYKIAFYNVENLFDPTNDSLTNDDAFTPEGFNRWSYQRYFRKINHISKVLIAMGEGKAPAIVGLSEIENAKVLRDLCYNSPLKNSGYKFVHYDSPDNRGIDVALLYRSEFVDIIHSEAIPIIFPFEPHSRNRDILYIIAVVHHRDTLHLFVNHWTSRYGGYAATIPKRNFYAKKIREKCDSIGHTHSNPNIIIMGDLNDYPTDESLITYLEAKGISDTIHPQNLYNLMLSFALSENRGTHKHEEFWGCLDQIIVSGNLLISHDSVRIKRSCAIIFSEAFMMEPDAKYGGEKPFRTYSGPRYFGGFSDHLPVFIELQME